MGKRPYQYRIEKTRSFNKEVYVNTYTLYTDDWFESGSRFAYSLHTTEKSALKYESFSWWCPNGKPKTAFVSQKTLEAVTKEPKTHRGEGLFVSMER